MTEGKIIALYMPIRGQPLRFVVHRRVNSSREVLELYRCRTLRELITEALTVLNSVGPGFMARMQKLDDDEFQKSRHKSRRYVADSRDLLYINNPRLTDKHSVRVLDCWVVTNVNRMVANHIVWLACKAAGIKRGNITKLAL